MGPLLERLHGIGPSLSSKITTAYGSAEAFEAACKRLELGPLLRIEGLSERRAFQIVSEVRSEGVKELAATDRAREVRRDLEDLIASYAQTTQGKHQLRLLPLLRDAAAIDASLQRVIQARSRVESLDRPAVQRHLQRLAPLRDPPRVSTNRRVLVVEDPDEEMAARGRGLDRWLRIGVLNDIREGLDAGVTILDATADGIDDGAVEAPVVRVKLTDALWKLVPELSLELVRLNRTTLEAMAGLARLTGATSRAGEALAAAEEPPSLKANLRDAAQEALVAAQGTLESRLASLSLTGLQVLEVLSRGSSRSLDEVRTAAVLDGREVFKQRTGLAIDPFEAGLPLGLDDELLLETERKRHAGDAEASFRRSQEAARRIEALRPAVAEELERWIAFDVEIALGSFAADFNLQPAVTGARLRFRSGSNLRLRRLGDVQPVAYELGAEAPVAVLTGANSGGKSSLLELLAQLVILHHWGLPVPAEDAEIPILEELHCVAPVRGGDAGAFESFLRDLFPPLTSPGGKLLLLDEVENVTELEAAGRILGVFIDEVVRTRCMAVVVTHLPSEVLAHAKAPVRVDGIDAVGLDERFNLIVDRQPKLNHWARSTPELILRRVHSKSQGAVKELFGRILRLWDANPAQAETRARK